MSELRWPSDGDRYKAFTSLLRRPTLVIFLLALAVIGIWVTLYASQWGPWAFSDGVGYLVTARNLEEGKGLGLYRPSGTFVPTVTHPPLFPFLLAAFTSITGDVLQAARWLNSLLISVLVVAVPLLFRRMIGLASLAAILGLLMIIHPGIVLMFLSAMSEPLFVVAGTTSLLTICLYLGSPKLRYFALACVLAAAAMLARYVGLAYVAAGALALFLLDKPGPGRQRLLRAAAYSAVAILPTLIFVAYWMQTPYARTVRRFGLPPSLGETISLFVSRVGQSLWSWKPVPTPAVLGAIARSPGERIALVLILVGLLFAAIALARWLHLDSATAAAGHMQYSHTNPWLLLKTFSLFVGVFLGAMFLAFAFGLPTPDIDSRTLFPVLPAIIIIAIGGVRPLLARLPRSKYVSWAVTGLLVAFAAGSVPAALDIVAGIHRTGLGFTAKEWHQSETMEFVESLDPQAILVSNSPEAIMLFSGRSAYYLSYNGTRNPSSDESGSATSLSDVDQLICGRGGFLILFDEALDGVDSGVSSGSAPAYLSCEAEAVHLSPDGTVYRSAVAR